MLANEVVENVMITEIPIKVQKQTITGLCHMPSNGVSPVLIGMEFLRKSQRVLVIAKNKIFLPEEEKVRFSLGNE